MHFRSEDGVKIGVVGAGRMGRVHARAISHASEHACLSGVADRDHLAAQSLAEIFGTKIVDIDDFFRPGAVDAVVLATPPDSHDHLGCRFLEAGISVLCEKPLARTLPEASRLLAVAGKARERGAVFTVSCKFLFADGVADALRLLRSGTIGRPLHLDLNFCLDVDLSGTWYVNREISGGGVLADRGPQALDLVRAMLGPISCVRAMSSRESRYRVEDSVELTLENAKGASAHSLLSWRPEGVSDIYARLETELAEIEIGWSGCRLRRRGEDWKPFSEGYSQERAFRNQLLAFIAAIHGEAPFPVEHDHFLDVARVIDAAYRSGLNGQAIWLGPSAHDHSEAIADTVD